MKIITIMICLLCFVNFSYADEARDTDEFAREYIQELKDKTKSKGEKADTGWSLDTQLKSGVASYEEDELGVSSEHETPYTELLARGVYQGDSGIEMGIGSSFGYAFSDTETWYVDGLKYQTNDLNFYRFNLNGALGLRLPLQEDASLHFTPYIGYGFRLIKFERSNFNILNVITSTEVVSEKYYIHHADCGIKLDMDLTDKLTLSPSWAYGYVFYNQADNSALGTIKGGGGFLFDVNIDLKYSLSESWQLLLGGFSEYQKLNGGEQNNIIWPDNSLKIYGGKLAARFVF